MYKLGAWSGTLFYSILTHLYIEFCFSGKESYIKKVSMFPTKQIAIEKIKKLLKRNPNGPNQHKKLSSKLTNAKNVMFEDNQVWQKFSNSLEVK